MLFHIIKECVSYTLVRKHFYIVRTYELLKLVRPTFDGDGGRHQILSEGQVGIHGVPMSAVWISLL